MTPARQLLTRLFSYGGCWVFTVALIVLAVCKLFEWHYVTTMLAADGWILGKVVWMGFLTFWLFELWINRICNARLLAILVPELRRVTPVQPGDSGHARSQHFVAAAMVPGSAAQSNGQALRWSLTSLGFQVERNGKPRSVFSRHDLLRALANDDVWDSRWSGIDSMRDVWTKIGRRCDSYFVAVNSIVAVLAIAITVFSWSRDREPTIRTSIAAAGTFDLAAKMFPASNGAPPLARPRCLLIAASGGGSRAAVFTQAALRGLDSLGAADDVVLASGVSGGGAALAYFAAHRAQLTEATTPELHATAWKRFEQAMAASYIAEVLAHFGSFDLIWRQRLGTILAREFEAQFFPPAGTAARSSLAAAPAAATIPPCLLLQDAGLGLLFNTTLQAERHGDDGKRSSQFAGTRLLLTNLADTGGFPRAAAAHEAGLGLRFTLVNGGGIPLAAAAALTANFPPVFRDASIEVGGQGVEEAATYWVTDGGVLENRGDLALLYALLDVLKRQARRQGSVLPDIHVVIIDASAISTNYDGLPAAAALGAAGARAADQLARELRSDVEAASRAIGIEPAREPDPQPTTKPLLWFHVLRMPAVFCVDGGVGTHWMLPETIGLTGEDGGREVTASLTREEFLNVLQQQFSDAPSPTGPAEPVQRWIRADTMARFCEQWGRLRAAMGSR